MIYGYDKTSDSFFALDYNYKRNFGTSQIPSKEYLSSLTSMHFSNYLNFIKAKKDLIFKFDYERSLRLIKCYINSENAYPNYEEYKINIFGYESVERSLHVMSDIGLNIISIRAIMEHKDIMMKYFNYIIENHFIDNKEIVDKYNNINKQMHIIFMKILKKEIANINSKNYLEEYDVIRKLNEKEAILLENYLKN